MRIEMTWQDTSRMLRLSLACGSRMIGPRPRLIEVRMADEARTQMVRLDGSPTTVTL